MPEQKISILREHLIDKVPVSDLCDKHQISAVNFYSWQRQLFEEGSVLFERKTNGANKKRQEDARAARIVDLEARLQNKNDVMAELLEEYVKLKKATGGP